jgi:hypothetical protein
VPWLPAWLPERQEGPLPGGQRACDLGALEGIRTPNLLIRRSMESVHLVRRNPYPQVSVLPGVRHRRHSPVPSGQSVRNCEIPSGIAEPVTSSVSECRLSKSASILALVTWACARCALVGDLPVSYIYTGDPRRSRAAVGSSLEQGADRTGDRLRVSSGQPPGGSKDLAMGRSGGEATSSDAPASLMQ